MWTEYVVNNGLSDKGPLALVLTVGQKKETIVDPVYILLVECSLSRS